MKKHDEHGTHCPTQKEYYTTNGHESLKSMNNEQLAMNNDNSSQSYPTQSTPPISGVIERRFTCHTAG